MKVFLSAFLATIFSFCLSNEAEAHKMCKGPFGSELCPHPHIPSGGGSSACPLCNINSPLVEIITPRSAPEPAAAASHQLFFQNQCTDTPVKVGVTVHQGGQWLSVGWFDIPATETIPLTGANTGSAHFYFYAEQVDGTAYWGADDQKAEIEGNIYNMKRVELGTTPTIFTMRLNC